MPSTHSTHGTTGTDSCRRCKPDGTSNVTTADCTAHVWPLWCGSGNAACLWECLVARTPLGMCRGDGAHPFEEQHIRNIWRLLCARRAPRRGGAQTDSLALCAQLCRRMRSADAFTLALYSTAVAALTRSSQSANSERTALSCAQQWRSAGPNAVGHRGSAPSQPQCRLVRLLDMTALHRRRGLKPKEASCV